MTPTKSDKRKTPRVPVLHNIVEPINLFYKTEEGKEQSVLAILADLSSAGMRLISFLEAPFSSHLELTMDIPALGKLAIKGKTAWVKKKDAVFTMGIEFSEIPAETALKIKHMAEDFADCDTRILLHLPEVCSPACKAHVLCNKIHKDDSLFTK